ncbi:Eco57I restriction-modification methylase domain-containing protein [Pseudomonadota bacterium 24LQ007]
MLEKLGFKEKDSLFHAYVREHYSTWMSNDSNIKENYIASFHLWLKDFKFSRGNLDTQRKINKSKLESIFSVKLEDQDDLFKLTYSIDCFYVSFLTLIAARKIDSAFSSSKTAHYLSFNFFKENGILNYYIPKNIYLGAGSSNTLNCLNLLCDKICSLTVGSSNIDLIREIFHEIYPKEIRHSLGEFYTPDWLCQNICDFNKSTMASGLTLDPTCGSGTFLVTALNQMKGINKINNIMGFDINSVSVFSAKTNLILNLDVDEIKNKILPIFTSNVLDIEQEAGTKTLNKNWDVIYNKIRRISTSTSCGFSENEIEELDALGKLVPKLIEGKIDVIIGNPPWVNWEYLPKEYREKYKILWKRYGLFDHAGINSGFIKEDISSLITYICSDKFLKTGGKISFVVKESLFKSTKQAAGFRKFYIAPSSENLGVYLLEDLTQFNAFNGAINNTVVFHAQKGKPTSYPVEYLTWKIIPKSRLLDTDQLEKALKLTTRTKKLAVPSNPADSTSGWASVSPELYTNMRLLTGKSFYKARTGVFTGGANGIYWLNIIDKPSVGISRVNNLTDRAKIKVKNVEVELENTHLYPYASGSDLSAWHFGYKKYIVCPHTATTKMYPIPMDELEKNEPLTASFFRLFEKELIARKGFTSFDRKIHDEYFYTLQRIGDYTFSKYKVAWKYISSKFVCAVIEDVLDPYLGQKTVIPNEKIIYIGLNNREEAFFLCGILSSSYFSELIDSFKVNTQISPSTISNLNIPRYEPTRQSHKKISALCEKGHHDLDNIDYYISELDRYVIEAIKENEPQTNKVAMPAGIAVQEGFGF